MSTGAIIAIAVGAVIVVALIAYTAIVARRRRLEGRRHEAKSLHRQASVQSAEVERARATADEHAARSRRAQAEAEEKTAEARRNHALAQKRASEADEGAERARARVTIALALSTPTRATRGRTKPWSSTGADGLQTVSAGRFPVTPRSMGPFRMNRNPSNRADHSNPPRRLFEPLSGAGSR